MVLATARRVTEFAFDEPVDVLQAELASAFSKKRPARAKKLSKAEETFAFHCRAHRLEPPEREYVFAKDLGRRWRFDFAWPVHKIAVEVEGLAMRMIGGQLVCVGRHTTVTGFRADLEKYNTATMLGWRVLRFEQQEIKNGNAILLVARALAEAAARINAGNPC